MHSGRGILRALSSALTTALLASLLLVVGTTDGARTPEVAELPPTRPVVGSTYLCSGYAGCRNAGYSDAGYGSANGQMYWRMYSGHNCTNYAAYRMIKAGMPNVRPWEGGGNATYWGQYMSEITDQRPAVGAIAWWRAYDGGVGSSGHVAYVEKVVSDTEIIISEDSWGGDFHWRRITKDSGRWPTGFIHFVDAAKTITNTKAPTITGTPRVDEPLAVDPGRWDPDARLSYQWLSAGEPIDGATTRSITPTAAQQGTRLKVRVTARKKGYEQATVTTAPTTRVARGELAASALPTVTGEPMVDEQLTATPPTWTPRQDELVYRWRADGERIRGASGPRLTLTRALVGKAVSVTTVATRDGYTRSSVTSDTVGPVVVGDIEVTEPFAVSGKPRLGRQLSLSGGSTQPDDAQVALRWLRDGVPVRGATDASYAPTDADLGATLSVRATITRRNYADRVETVTVGPVATRPTVTARATGKPRRAVVAVALTAPGVEEVQGPVKVRVGGKDVVVDLVDGRARAVVTDLRPGERTVRVRYAGHGAVLPARSVTTVVVTR